MKKAFTLVESLGVIVILMLLIGAGVFYLAGARDGAMRQQTKAKLATLAAQLEAIKMKEGKYPENGNLPDSINATDAWGDLVNYSSPLERDRFTLTSPAGTDDNKDDIVYDSKEN